jgi:sugar PTS system EIIA component
MVEVLSPVAGVRQEITDLPDPVFSGGLVGPGAAIEPRRGDQTAVAPVAGKLVKLHPHAFVVVSELGPRVLVHLGIDTVHMDGAGFTLLAEEQDQVSAGDAVVRWDPGYVVDSGHSAMCAVVVLDCPFPATALSTAGSAVATCEPLFTVDC